MRIVVNSVNGCAIMEAPEGNRLTEWKEKEMTEYMQNFIDNPERFAIDYVGNALSILTHALEWLNLSNSKYVDHVVRESGLDWLESRECEARAKGLLDAYYVLSTHKIPAASLAIYEEIHLVATTFDLDDFIPAYDVLPDLREK